MKTEYYITYQLETYDLIDDYAYFIKLMYSRLSMFQRSKFELTFDKKNKKVIFSFLEI
jgi:hypothetical protein